MTTARLRASAFTLIELLVVISIIALLIGILLPVLGTSRREAYAIKCGSNMRQIVTAMTGYAAENDGYYPPSYVYPDTPYAGGSGYHWSIPPNTLGSTNDVNGYVHWSFALLSNKTVETEAFRCPVFDRNGLPPTNPSPEILALFPEMSAGSGGTRDRQAELMSYTANSVLVPRNKFSTGSGVRANQLVRSSQVRKPSGTIMITEFVDNINAVSDSSHIVKTHRPVQPIVQALSGDHTDATTFPDPISDVGAAGNWLLSPWNNVRTSTQSLIDQPLNTIGRHHPGGGKEVGGEGTTNFARADGSCIRKTLIDTLRERQWGDRYYSLTGSPAIHYVGN